MRTANPISNKLLARIRRRGRGWVFTSRDFVGLGTRPAVDQALSRLARKGMIRRIAPGLYDYPRTRSDMGGTLSPPPHAVVQAVARKTGTRLLPTGAMSANVLGLSTQVPAKMIYLTDGRSRTLRVGPYTLVFKHASPRTMAVSAQTSAVVFQALRYLGPEGVTDAVIRKLRATLSDKDKSQLKKDMRHAMGWMRPVLMRIAARSGVK